MAFVLDQTKPNQKYFEAICGIPHPSTEEKAVSDYVCSVAEKLGLNYEQDKLGNVIVRKPASKGCEDAPVVMLEGHMDMVCVKTPESTHDFSHDPIEIYVDGSSIILKKYEPTCVLCGDAKNITVYKGKNICANCLKELKKA